MRFTASSCCLLIVLMAASLVADESVAPAKPNVLFILTDDQGWPTLGCYGNKLVPTPHLDKFARDGMRFTDAYVLPQCTPTRAAFLTGQHSARNGMWHVIPWYGYPWARVAEPAYRENLSRETFTLPKGLRAAGYATGMAGKWHLTNDADGDYVSLKPGGADAFGFDYVAPQSSAGSHDTGDKNVDLFTDQTIAFIEKNRDRPWFFYLAHHTIHGKVSAPPELVAKYRGKGAPEKGLHNATYLAAIEHLDNSIGRLTGRLDELKLRDNTVVVFCSDNGGVNTSYAAPAWVKDPPDGSKPLRVREQQFDNAPLRSGKGSAYEGGIRVPMIVRWPGAVKPESVSHTPVHIVDWLPTFLELAGAKAPADHKLDGVSLVPLLRGGQIEPRPLYWYMPLYDLRWCATPCAVIRDGDWKLIESFGDWFDDHDGSYHVGGRLQLFNLSQDLGEKTNLAEKEPNRAAAMRDRLHAWIKSVPAEIPRENQHFDAPRALVETKDKQPWNK